MTRFLHSTLLLLILFFSGCVAPVMVTPPAEIQHEPEAAASAPAPQTRPELAPPSPSVGALPPPVSNGSSSIEGIGSSGGGIGEGSGLGYGSSGASGSSSAKKQTVNNRQPASGDKSEISYDAQESMPNFKWPPPKASAREVIPDLFLRRSGRGIILFKNVDDILRSALDNCGYSESSYYGIPGGFALATRIEQMNKNGIPKSGDIRWSLKTSPINPFSDFSAYLTALFKGNPGYYRVIVFIITPNGFSQGTTEPSEVEVLDWIGKGFDKLPPEVGMWPYTDAHRCTALIYEFKKTPQSSKPVIPGSLPGKTHLMRSGIWNNLQPTTKK
jgi:hypothetical protein